MTARCVMVLGTSSGAGKSWVTTALCRYYSNQGLRVAPFKAQNMSNNARVVAHVVRAAPEAVGAQAGSPQPMHEVGEIGSAQYFQALAARAEPEVRMNPLLLKPEADTHSQVVLMGQVSAELTALPWRGRSERVWPQIAAALDALRAENDVVVIEGAGSPAEINLMANDIVNLRVARHADARCLLVTDIDRGGAFAHLYGTWALLPEEDRARIKGFVLNKFRGDAALLAPAPQQIEELTQVPVVAVVPMRFGHGLPEEDGLFDDSATGASVVGEAGSSSDADNTSLRPHHIAIIAYPRISNLDEFQPLKNVPGLHVTWARTPSQVRGADTVILPGSKATASDLAWLRDQGLDAAIAEHAARGNRVLGICGGLQMLGEALIDMHGVESQGNAPGLGLLPLVTTFEPQKTVRRSRVRLGEVDGLWSALSLVEVAGYEIHSGQTAQHPAMAAKGGVAREVAAGLAWQNVAGNVLGIYLHGMFEDAAVVRALFGAQALSLEDVFERLAAEVQADFLPGVLDALIA
ncbi:cobyric acid synthase [Ottowia thiooxydans]|uniref:Cobyric acid synthase n=1 Tax=Ottowia thiooxydans TaxID=219182 RepID=A0ABV2Q699_9BURK